MTKLSRNVKVFGLASFLRDTASEMVYPLLPGFLLSLGAGPGALGVVEGIAETTAALLKALSGFVSDRLTRKKPLVVAGYSVSAAATPVLALAAAWPVVALARFLDRVGKGIRTAPRDALIASSTTDAESGRAFGFHRAMDTLGAVAGPLIGALLFGLMGSYRAVIWLSLVPGLLTVLVLAVGIREAASQRDRAPWNPRELPLGFWLFLGGVALFSLGNSSNAFLLMRAKDVGIPEVAIPLLYAVFNITYASSAYPAGALADRVGKLRVYILGLLIYGITYFGFAFWANPASLWFWMALYGLFYGMADGTARALISGVVPEGLRGTAYGIYHGSVGLLLLPASLLAGFLWEAVGAQAPFVLGGTCALGAAGMLGLSLGGRIR